MPSLWESSPIFLQCSMPFLFMVYDYSLFVFLYAHSLNDFFPHISWFLLALANTSSILSTAHIIYTSKLISWIQNSLKLWTSVSPSDPQIILISSAIMKWNPCYQNVTYIWEVHLWCHNEMESLLWKCDLYMGGTSLMP